MSKFFFKGRPDVMGNYGKNGYKPEPNVKLGSESLPLVLTVNSKARKTEVEALIEQHGFIAQVTLNPDADENIKDLEAAINKPKTQRFEKTPERNEPCSCGSGKKYKKCCG